MTPIDKLEKLEALLKEAWTERSMQLQGLDAPEEARHALREASWGEMPGLLSDVRGLRELVAALPKCQGAWLKGSGGHAIFSRDCARTATWIDEDRTGCDDWRFCDEHAPERLKNNGHVDAIEELPYAGVLRRLQP